MIHEVIAFDLDDTLVPTFESFQEYSKDEYNVFITSYEDMDVRSEELTQLYGKKPFEILQDYFHTDHAFEMKPSAECLQVLEDLKAAGKTLPIITARPIDKYDGTQEFARKVFNGLYDGIYLCGNPKHFSMIHEKYEVCQRLYATALIDDFPSHVQKCIGTTVNPYYYNPEGNELEGIKTVRSLSEFGNLMLSESQ